MNLLQLFEAESRFVIYINGKPSAHYATAAEAKKFVEFVKSKYPDAECKIKNEMHEDTGAVEAIQQVGQPRVEDEGEPTGVVVSVNYSVNGHEYQVLTFKEFEEDLGPLMQLKGGRAQQTKRPAPNAGHYTTHIFDTATDGDMIATIETNNGQAREVENFGNPAYQMKSPLAMSLYRKTLARQSKISCMGSHWIRRL